MTSRYNYHFLIFLILIVSVVMPEMSTGHNFAGKIRCFECHERLPVGGAALRLKPKIEKVCIKCHSLEKRLTHPIGMIPKVKIPLDMPLDKEGKINCITCHDVHMSPISKLTGKKTYYLRRILKGKKFCYSCHAKLPI